MAKDPYPNINEFGRGTPTCDGDAIGCAVCVCADMLVRYDKPIPRLKGGTPNLIALGRRMGKRCREEYGGIHGKALEGTCVGGKWSTCCIHLELLANDMQSKRTWRTWPQIVGLVKQGKPVAIAGKYGEFPKVSPTSYDSNTPARGRSDTYVDGHMVVAWDVESFNDDGSVERFRVSDGDFGSPGRPRQPPHSSIARADLKAFFDSLQWRTTAIMKHPPSLTSDSGLTLTAEGDKVIIHPEPGEERRRFWTYTVVDGKITGRRSGSTGGFSAEATEPVMVRWPDRDRAFTLVQLLTSVRKGQFVNAKHVAEED